MQVNKLSLENIFDPSIRLVVPLFQRTYVWKREQNWQPLWESIRETADRRVDQKPIRPHFLGAVVVNHLNNPMGTIDSREVIDGQQRLTTLQLVIAAIRDYCSLFADDFEAAFAKLTENNVPLSKDEDDKFKVWPTNFDREDFRRVMDAGSPQAVYKAYGAKHMFREDGLFSDDPVVHDYLARRIAVSEDDRRADYQQLNTMQRNEINPIVGEMKRVDRDIPNAYLYFYSVISDWLGPVDNTNTDS